MSQFIFMVNGNIISLWVEKQLGIAKKSYKNIPCFLICFSSFSCALVELLGHLEVMVISRMLSSSKYQECVVSTEGWLRKPCWYLQRGCNNQEKGAEKCFNWIWEHDTKQIIQSLSLLIIIKGLTFPPFILPKYLRSTEMKCLISTSAFKW